MGAMPDELVLSNEELAKATEDLKAAGDSQPEDSGPVEVPTDDAVDPSIPKGSLEADADLKLPVPDGWESEDELGEEDAVTAESAEEEPQQEAVKAEKPNVLRYKVGGKTEEVDLNDKEELIKKLSLHEGARPVFSERDTLRKENAKFRETWDKFNKMSGADLFKLKEGKSIDEYIDERIARKQRYEEATEEERQYLGMEDKFADLQRQTETETERYTKEREAWEKEKADLQKSIEDAQVRELNAVLHPEFMKHEYSQKVDDPDLAAELNDVLWDQTNLYINKHYGDETEITPAIAREAYAKVSKLLDRNAEQAVGKKLKEATETKKATAKKQAQVASTRNYTKDVGDTEELAALAKDPVALFRKMTSRKALKKYG